MTAAAWQETLAKIQAEARQLSPAQVLLTLVAAPLFLAGWLVCKSLRVAWVGFSWAWVAALVGWRYAGGMRGLPGRPDRQQVPL